MSFQICLLGSNWLRNFSSHYISRVWHSTVENFVKTLILWLTIPFWKCPNLSLGNFGTISNDRKHHPISGWVSTFGQEKHFLSKSQCLYPFFLFPHYLFLKVRCHTPIIQPRRNCKLRFENSHEKIHSLFSPQLIFPH